MLAIEDESYELLASCRAGAGKINWRPAPVETIVELDGFGRLDEDAYASPKKNMSPKKHVKSPRKLYSDSPKKKLADPFFNPGFVRADVDVELGTGSTCDDESEEEKLETIEKVEKMGFNYLSGNDKLDPNNSLLFFQNELNRRRGRRSPRPSQHTNDLDKILQTNNTQ